VYVLVWLGGPFLLGILLSAAFARGWRWLCALLALGLLIGFFFVLAVYMNAPPDFEHSNGCSDCGMYWGRYWEPVFVIYLTVIGCLLYLLGIAVGALGRALLKYARRQRLA
jgi:hypothetical protein